MTSPGGLLLVLAVSIVSQLVARAAQHPDRPS